MQYFIEEVVDDLKEICFLSNLKFKHAAALICNQKIIAKAYNVKKLGHRNSIHAEMAIIHQTPKKIFDSLELNIVVIRVSNNGNIINSKPCFHCTEKIKKYNIGNVYYSNKFGEIVCETASDMETNYISSGFCYNSL